MFNDIEYNLKDISNNTIDITFKNFYIWTQNNNIEFYIISSGFKTIIKNLLPYINDELIFGNDVRINDKNKWSVEFYNKDNSSISKKDCIQKLNKSNHKTIFIGDGLSDFKVINNVDYLFCKKDSLLHLKCIDENHSHIVFSDFDEVLEKIKSL